MVAAAIIAGCAKPALTITTNSLAAGKSGEAYSQTLQATGGTPPYTWSIASGVLPAGLTLDPVTGTISGTPTTPVTSTFVVKVTDSTGASVTKLLSITIVLSIAFAVPASLPAATVGVPYSYSFASETNPSGGQLPYTFYLGSGVGFPPFGLVLDLNGLLSGTPTAEGTRQFQVCVKDLGGNQACGMTSLTVEEGPQTFRGSFNGSGDFIRPYPPYTSCTFSDTFSGTIDLTITLHTNNTYSGSVNVSGEFVSIAIAGSTESFTCMDSSCPWSSTNEISGTSPSIVWSTSFVTPGGSTVTGDFTGTLSENSINGNMVVTFDTSTGSATIPITLTKQQ